jgi:ribosome maturation factor RimP
MDKLAPATSQTEQHQVGRRPAFFMRVSRAFSPNGQPVIGSTHKSLQALIAPPLAEMGYRLVRLTLGSEVPPSLQIMAEPLSGDSMTVAGCAEVSRKVSRILDDADPIDSDYVLEVSSPGLDRPLVERQDFVRFAGMEAKIEAANLIDGRRKFKGQLVGATDKAARIAITDKGEKREFEIPFDNIAGAKLVLTDALIKGSSGRS